MLSLLVISCDQSAILYSIEVTPKPNPPAISGSPGRVVEYDLGSSPALYVSNGKIYRYDSPKWTEIDQPPGAQRVQNIAATASYLYARISTNAEISGDQLHRYDTANDWNRVDTPGSVSAMHGANDTLFITATDGKNYYRTDTVTSFERLGDDAANGIIAAAARLSTNYYLALPGGVYYSSAPTGTWTKQDNTGAVLGFAVHGTTLYGITADSRLVVITDAASPTAEIKNLSITGSPTGAIEYYNGALLVGRRYTGSYTYGYVEVNPSDYSVSAGLPVSVLDDQAYARYEESLGRRVINHLYVTTGGEIFASTQLKGLWVYRTTNGVGEWNIQD
jgi:hypothetical protein